MPPRSPKVDLGCPSFVCKSCLATLRRAPRPSAIVALGLRKSSSQATGEKPPLAFSTDRPSSAAAARPNDDAERLRTLRNLGLLRESESAEPKVKVNYFEEAKGGKLRRLKGQDEFAGSLMDPGGEFAGQLEEMEQGLEKVNSIAKVLEERAFKAPLRPADQNTPSGNVETAYDTMADMQLMESYVRDQQSRTASSRSILINPGTGYRERHSILRLNEKLQRSAENLDRGRLGLKDRDRLWRCYSHSRTTLCENWNVVPREAWELLWDVLAADTPDNTNRMARIYALTKDMMLAGVPMSPERHLLAVESMFIEGWKKEAIDNHRRCATTLGANPKTFIDFWQLGLRMHCQVGDVERAERIANIILESRPESDARFLIPLIRAHVDHSSAGADKAYDVYEWLASLLGNKMTIGDYDQIISLFLAANQTEHAFGARDVLLLMKSKGVVLRPIQVNGLIGAWLRSGSADNYKHADDVGWAMINARLQFVRHRRAMQGLTMQAAEPGWPCATLETFSLLAENFQTRGLHVKVEEVWDAFAQAEIAPNSFMVNQLLSSYLGSGRGKDVASCWQRLSAEYQIPPDPWVFAVLWRSLSVNRLRSIPQEQLGSEILASRRLFADMVVHVRSFNGEGIDLSMARVILHTFRQLHDQVGLLVAYRTLRELFGYADPGPLVFELLLGTTNVAKTTARSAQAKRRLMLAVSQVENYLAHRQGELVSAGQLGANDDMTGEMKAAEMGNFLDLQLEADISVLPDAERQFVEAASQMGVYKSQ
ncbi:pentatricopeptide repeat protein [Apiospora saccharicola]|uniref:Pentatricopeptide repeat protein n=1 Tax=Apiospora saccharicola TaxID=335842 RepID=A0ABR1WJ01_9PEZI